MQTNNLKNDMKLYHGSKNNFTSIKRSQAGKADNIEVPENELLDAIYLTPDYGFALACATRPEGVTEIDDNNKVITFENPELFDPEEEVFVYELDIENIPKEKIIEVDDHQYAVDIDELKVLNKFLHKAKEVQKYYELKNWQEKQKEVNIGLKIR